MSAITATTPMSQSRPTGVVAAAVLAAATAVIYAIPWPGYMDPGVAIIAAAIGLELLFLAGVVGLWKLRRWGLFATISLGAVNGVFNLLGAADPDASAGWIAASIAMGLLFLAIVALAALPATRRAIH